MIAALLMVKDESTRILTTLESTVGVIDTLFLYDTGSTDDTINLADNFCQKNNITLHLKVGEFTDFANSRNVALQFARSIGFEYLLLLDSNDELIGGDVLVQICEKEKSSDRVAYFLQQNLDTRGKIVSFYNVRLLKKECDWLYVGSVHESFPNLAEKLSITGKISDVILYQDRTFDEEKSKRRHVRDYQLLLKDHLQDPENPRTIYYLGQTADSLQYQDAAYRFHKIRSMMGGNMEEKFLSTFRVACLARDLDEKIAWFLKSFTVLERVEPLIHLAEHYLQSGQLQLAFYFSKLACKLDYPKNSFQFVDKRAYDYLRWRLFAKICLQLNNDKGISAAKQAAEYSASEEDKNLVNAFNKKTIQLK